MFVIKKSIFWVIILLNLMILFAFQNCSKIAFQESNFEKPEALPFELRSIDVLATTLPPLGIPQSIKLSLTSRNISLSFLNQDYDSVQWIVTKNGTPTPAEYNRTFPTDPSAESPILTLDEGEHTVVATAVKALPDSSCTLTTTSPIIVSNSNECRVGITGPSVALLHQSEL